MMNPNTPPDSAPCGLKPDPTCRVKSETPHAVGRLTMPEAVFER